MIRMDALGAAGSGINAALLQVAAAANNVANLQTTKPMEGAAFQGDDPVLTESSSGGVEVGMIAPAGTEEGIPVSQPENPQADAEGMVRLPDIDLGGQMVDLLVAQQAVAANVVTINRAVDSYRDLLSMTNSDRSRNAAAEPVSL